MTRTGRRITWGGQNGTTDAQAVTADKEELVIIYGGSNNAGSVTQNIILPTTGPSGSIITWSSSNSGIVAVNGTVSRPSYSSGNLSITLTATISKGNANDTKSFFITVIKAPATDAEAVAEDKVALAVTYGTGDNSGNVTQNITLATSGSSGTTITLGSTNTGIIAINGTVIRPVYGAGNASVTLTATLSKGSSNDTKVFNITVMETPQTDAQAVAVDKAALAITYGGSDSAGSVTQNVTLPTTGSSGTTINWVSSNTAVISNSGTVTRPAYGSGNASSTLTATISKGIANDTKQFILTVIENTAAPRNGLVAEYLFNGNASDSSGNGNHGTVYGAATTTDRFGNANSAYSFDGVDDLIRIPENSSFKPTNEISLNAWVKLTAHNSVSHIISLDYRANGTWNDPWSVYMLSCDWAYKYAYTQFKSATILDPDELQLNTWYLLSSTYDGQNLKLYVNGVEKASSTLTGPIDYGTSHDLAIGNRSPYSQGFGFTGVIDDVRIYNRALSATETQALYNESNNSTWVKTIGGTGDDKGSSVIVDNTSNIYVAGYFTGTVDFDPGTGVDNKTSQGGTDIFLTKFDVTGNYLWTKVFGGTGNDFQTDGGTNMLAVDDSNNIYIGASFTGTVDFDPGAGQDLGSGYEMSPVIWKINSDGSYGWKKIFNISPPGYSQVNALRFDSSQNLFILGGFEYTVDFDPGASTDSKSSGGYTDIFFTKINSDTSYGWTKTVGSGVGANNQTGNDLLIKSNDSIYYVGYIQKYSGSGSVDMDPMAGVDTKNPVNGHDFYLTKLTNESTYAWTRLWTGTGLSEAWSITANSNGDYYVAGTFAGTMDFDPGAGVDQKTAVGATDIFIIKFNADDSYAWTKTISAAGMNSSWSSIKAHGNSIYLTSCFNGTVNFNLSSGTVTKTSAGGRDIFILKIEQ